MMSFVIGIISGFSYGCGLLNGWAWRFSLLHFRAHRALFTLFHGRYAFHFPHAHFAHTVFAAFALTIFAALGTLSILAAFAFFTAWHFHTHAGLRSALRIGASGNKSQHNDG
jgi:hypothetical protein